jgi:non-specific serine/threonine protein kinase
VGACADLADLLLKSCSGLKILCTSRETLDVAGETVWPVPPLSRPTAGSEEGPEALSRYEAVGLFVERAGTAAPGFDLTAENAVGVAGICLRLDGLPLAIELAAARVRMLSPVQISARLDDALGLLTGGSRTAPSLQVPGVGSTAPGYSNVRSLSARNGRNGAAGCGRPAKSSCGHT